MLDNFLRKFWRMLGKYLKILRKFVTLFEKNLINFGKEYWNVREIKDIFEKKI